MALHYKRKHTAPTDSQKTLRKMLALIPVLVVAVLCYSVTAYAWFSASIVNRGNVIQTTTFGLEVSVIGSDNQPVEPSDGVYTLVDNQSYTVTLTKTGEASTGYCVVKAGEDTYYTDPITTKSPSLTFTIAKAGQYTFTAVWGCYDGTGIIINDSIGTPMNAANGPNAFQTADDTESDVSREPSETTAPEASTTTQPTEYQTQQPTDSPTESSSEPTVTEPSTGAEQTGAIA